MSQVCSQVIQVQKRELLQLKLNYNFYIKGRFWRSLKYEDVYPSSYNNIKEARAGIKLNLDLLLTKGDVILNLKGTELVVLSTCETGVVSLKSSESVSVLSKAFIQAGAKRVVASLWAVSDVGTKKFMGNFYESLHNKFPYDKALRVAKIKMIRENISPVFWSSFILNGI